MKNKSKYQFKSDSKSDTNLRKNQIIFSPEKSTSCSRIRHLNLNELLKEHFTENHSKK